MKYFIKNIKVLLAYMLLLSACSEIDSPISSKDVVLKIETKWLADSKGEKKLIIYNKEYDRNGKLIKLVEYDTLGKAYKVHHFQYEATHSSETIEYLQNDQDNKGKVAVIYSGMDSRGRVADKVELSQSGDTLSKHSYKYDESGKLVEAVSNYATSNQNILTQYIYNGFGSLGSTVVKDLTTGNTIKSDSLVYHNAKATIDKLTIDDKGQIRTIVSTSYNKFGKIYKEIENNPNTKIINTYIYEYIYY